MPGAVFLSYASQDAGAALRMCDALRAAGVEVWFDQSELRGGDAWDQSIRKQIKECALFVPIVSANTQARREGYFRLEWKLADDRTHLMAKGTRFIMPVCVDGTRDWEAIVPDSFTNVQWTRLPGGDEPAPFAERVGRLLGGEPEAATIRDSGRETARVPLPIGKRGWFRWWMAPVFLIVAMVVYNGVRPRRSPQEIAQLITTAQSFVQAVQKTSAEAGAPAQAMPAPPPLSEARQLVVKARAVFEPLDETRDDCALAEDLLKQAVARDSADAEVWAAYAQLDTQFIARGWDTSDGRREAQINAAQRALRLDPQSFEARFAKAQTLGNSPREMDERERTWRTLHGERPDDKRVLRALARVIQQNGRVDEADALLDSSARLPGGDPLALYNKGQNLWFAGRIAEADSALAAAVAQKPFDGALLMQIWSEVDNHGDLDQARRILDRVSPATLREDRGGFFAFTVHYYGRRPEEALAALRNVPRDWLDDFWYRGPKGLLMGDALQMAGRPEAAALEWRAALKLAEARLEANPGNYIALASRLVLLADLGERDLAETLSITVREALRTAPSEKGTLPVYVRACILLGHKEEAIQKIGELVRGPLHRVSFPAWELRLNPWWDPLRTEPEFAAVVAEADAVEKADRSQAAARESASPETAAPLPAVPTPAPSGRTGPPPVAQVAPNSVAVLAFANLSDDRARARPPRRSEGSSALPTWSRAASERPAPP